MPRETITLANYINLAIGKASVEYDHDDDVWVAEVAELPGVLATGATVNECVDTLRSVIAGWVEVRQRRNLEIPELNLASAMVAIA
jgi:predicted RNase H-like HicB family nuclease